MNKSSASKALPLALLAVFFWSTSPTAFKIGLEHQGTFSLLLGASLASTFALGILLLFSGRLSQLRAFGRRDLALSALLGLLNPVAYYLVLFRAYDILPAQVAQPLNMIWPIVLVLISIPMLRQKVSWLSLAAMALSFSGVVVISLQGGEKAGDPENRLGIFLALSTSLTWALYWILNARSKTDPVARLFLNFVFSSIFLLALGWTGAGSFPSTGWAWISASYVGFFEMGITFVLWMLAMQKAGKSDRIGNLVYLAPFINLIFARQILHESIYLSSIIGIVLLVSGILIQNLSGRNAKG